MLMLTRFIGQSVMVGNDIRINVIDVKPGRNLDGKSSFVVRLGFEAPKEVPIDRSEVYLQKLAQKHSNDE